MPETLEVTFVAALQRVPPRQRALLLLCDVAGFAPHEGAEMLGLPVAWADRLLVEARALLVASLLRQGPGSTPTTTWACPAAPASTL
jgi:RNA polymerase sigma-70 factor, ECF subfamily